MGFHTFDAANAENLDDAAARYRYVSAEELGWAVGADGTDVLADLGSGTGFYTDDVAATAGTVYGVDVQAEMHEYYRGKGTPENVELVTAEVADLPFDEGELDGAFSTMTFHEFAAEDAIDEVARVVETGGRVAVADWSATGDGEAGPPVSERFGLDDAKRQFRAGGFDVEFGASRSETFLLVVRAP
ncbi:MULTISPECIES: class I SAM-dependent methyltransferase [Halolamina]|uniref:Methyltransferase domain-containing protein n=1 Tax=Halolamina pelagica TaxID=699431 RepID=A0A1I5N559_9EURY|nr:MULTISPECIES: class I SAM-dependent methyltransferase [Halolamina]NHX36290.1 class I SAM-dependent methyltransferase [Halolamina sp. R1-12]SFP16401.1 Methyltransferase domain-containing protein [Halolamina pelagica]